MRAHMGLSPTFQLAARYAFESAEVDTALRSLHAQGKLLEGEFLPKGLASRMVRSRDPPADSPQEPGATCAAKSSRWSSKLSRAC